LLEIIAHRGYSSRNPENTLASFDDAVNSGFPYIELDLHLTKDNVAIVMHDDSVDRTTNGKGLISELNLEQIKSLDAGSWFNKSFSCEKVPTFEEVLSRYKTQAHIFVEIKSSENDLLYEIKKCLDENFVDGKVDSRSNGQQLPIPGVSIISFLPDQVLKSKQILPNATLQGLLLLTSNFEDIEFCVSNKIKGFLPYIKSLNKEIVEMAHKNDLYVGAWGFSTPEEVEKAIALDLDGVTVDWPDAAQKILNS
tara:strand:+ start:117 stop:872 length:756 start_codon:yes stop_codon:yes gene_type:complete